MTIPFSSIQLLPLHSDRVACTMGKADRRVQLVMRHHRRGTELRCFHEGAVLWTELIPFGADHSSDVQRAVDDTRAAWEAKGWQCQCAAASARAERTAADAVPRYHEAGTDSCAVTPKCPTCGEPGRACSVSLRALRRTIGYECASCGHRWDVSDDRSLLWAEG